MDAAVVLVNRCLRTHDHPALAAAGRAAERVVPLFVYDEALLDSGFAAPNRVAFLHESLADLRATLQSLGADLVVRRGDPAAEAVAIARRVGAEAIFATADVSAYATRRQDRLLRAAGEACVAVELRPGVSVVDPGVLRPAGGDHFKVFTPFHRAWSRADWRRPEAPPGRLVLPDGIEAGTLPRPPARAEQSPERPAGGESAGRAALAAWARGGLATYGDTHDLVADDGTSQLSPYFHFGCLSASEVASRLAERPGGGPFTRQLCWRDFYHQVAAAFPGLPRHDYHPRRDRWRNDDTQTDELFEAWAEGRTGYPLVDAGMRQLRREGWMHNRARLVTASFLTKDLRIDWRRGAAHFLWWLVDGDIVQNSANWQWMAGTGNDTRPNRVLNPERQAERFDAQGAYIRRYVPELADLEAPAVRRPWTLGAQRLAELGYPAPIVEHAAAAGAFRTRGRSAPPDRLPGLG